MSGDAWDMERLMQGVSPPDLRPQVVTEAPCNERQQVWCQVSGIHVREVNNEGLYGQLLQLSEQGVLSEECAGDIDRVDLNLCVIQIFPRTSRELHRTT